MEAREIPKQRIWSILRRDFIENLRSICISYFENFEEIWNCLYVTKLRDHAFIM